MIAEQLQTVGAVVLYLMCVDPHWDPEGPSQPKVGQFDDALVVDEQVLGLQVSVQNPSAVTEQDPLQDLVQVALRETAQVFRGDTGRQHRYSEVTH